MSLRNFLSSDFYRLARWWLCYLFLQVSLHTLLVSLGAFFHFQLDHSVTIIEGWLYKNGWELLIVSKLTAMAIFFHLLRLQLYNPIKVSKLWQDGWTWPSHSLMVMVVFIVCALLGVFGIVRQPSNQSHLSYNVISFLGVTLWFVGDFFCLSTLVDLFKPANVLESRLTKTFFWLGFTLCLSLLIPDFYFNTHILHLHFLTLLMMLGLDKQSRSNAVAYIIILIAPLSTYVGLDPIWGSEFSPYKSARQTTLPFLLIIWMVSWGYYRNSENGKNRLVQAD